MATGHFAVEVSGFKETISLLGQIPGAVLKAMVTSSVILSAEGTEYWRSLVTVRTGNMKDSLDVKVRNLGFQVRMSFFVVQGGFYYRFQKNQEQWNAKLTKFLNKRAPQVVAQELDKEIARLG